ncbi:MAG: YgiT-type zinc finger protein [Leptospiraceae bacterium]|nr:YgiT-type zinc finger protein [Leptospiraceae bacterium]
MKCVHCAGEMEKRTAPFDIERKGYRIHWNAIPAWVCKQCGEPFFEETEVNKIQDVLSSIDMQKSLLA